MACNKLLKSSDSTEELQRAYSIRRVLSFRSARECRFGWICVDAAYRHARRENRVNFVGAGSETTLCILSGL